jgi:hypothetical protein
MSQYDERTQGITRREFTLESALAMLAGVTITISGCSDDSPDTPTSPTTDGNVNGTVSANHGHVATVTAAQITAAGALSLNIQGTATHPHTVSLSAEEVRNIGARQRVTKTSTSNDGHTHDVQFN